MNNIIAEYIGDDQVKLTHTLSGTNINTDLPPDNKGKGRTFSPTDLLVSSLGSCILLTMVLAAKRDNKEVTGISITLLKHMSDNPRRISLIDGTITFPPNFSNEEREKYMHYIKACPVHHSLNPSLVIDIKPV